MSSATLRVGTGLYWAIEKASGEPARIQPARVANSDAKALTRYLGALGLEVGPDRLNDLLVLLAVIMVEVAHPPASTRRCVVWWRPVSSPLRPARVAPGFPSGQPIR